jgi:hypothetical protein
MPITVLADVISRLAKVLKSSQSGPAGSIRVVEVLQPNFDLFNIIIEPKHAFATVDISAAGQICFTVPQNKRWFVYWIFKGTTANDVEVQRTNPAGPGYPSVVTEVLQGTTRSFMYVGFTMSAGETLTLSQGAVGDTSIRLNIQYAEYDIGV